MEEKTHWKKTFNYKYLGSQDLSVGENKLVEISDFYKEEVVGDGGKKEVCNIVKFKGVEKTMIFNKTNCKRTEGLYGPFVQDWIGKKIVIQVEKTKTKGKEIVDALRVKQVLPEPEQKIDYSGHIAKIKSCISLDELKAVFTALQPKEKAALENVKDEMKDLLTNGVESR